MTKFSLTKLENARNHPIEFARSLKNKESPFRNSKYLALQNAVLFYHKIKDKDKALVYFMEKLNKFSFQKKKREKDEYLINLHRYIHEYQNSGYSFIESRKRINLKIASNIFITGQIPIIYLKPNLGYCVLFFIQKFSIWDKELRFPIVQDYFSTQEYKCNINEIDVGVYCFETNKYHTKSFSRPTIDSAITELNRIGRIMEENL
jgi:hypothetical protein